MEDSDNWVHLSHGQQRQEQKTNIVDENKSVLYLFSLFSRWSWWLYVFLHILIFMIYDLVMSVVSHVSPLYPAGSSRRTQFPPNHLSIIQSRAATLDMRLDPDQVQKWLTIHWPRICPPPASPHASQPPVVRRPGCNIESNLVHITDPR